MSKDFSQANFELISNSLVKVSGITELNLTYFFLLLSVSFSIRLYGSRKTETKVNIERVRVRELPSLLNFVYY